MSGSSRDLLRLGLIGLDTSHAATVARLLADPAGRERFGAVVSGAWPGIASADLAASYGRIDDITRQVCTDYGVPRATSPDEIAADADLIMITAVDARRHRELVERVASHGLPIFVDKPLATTVADADAILELAAEAGTPIMSASAKRFARAFTTVRARRGADDVDVVRLAGPMPAQAPLTPTLWYGVHLIELTYAVLGPGCQRVAARRDTDLTRIEAEWSGGRRAIMTGTDHWHPRTTGTIVRTGGETEFIIDGEDPDMFAGLLSEVVAFGRTRTSPVPVAELREIVALIAAIDASLATGREITL